VEHQIAFERGRPPAGLRQQVKSIDGALKILVRWVNVKLGCKAGAGCRPTAGRKERAAWPCWSHSREAWPVFGIICRPTFRSGEGDSFDSHRKIVKEAIAIAMHAK